MKRRKTRQKSHEVAEEDVNREEAKVRSKKGDKTKKRKKEAVKGAWFL